jgi:heme A synthase
VVFQWPLALAVLHNAGAAAMLVAVLIVNYRAFAAARNLVAPLRRAQAGAAG